MAEVIFCNILDVFVSVTFIRHTCLAQSVHKPSDIILVRTNN